MQAPLMNAEVVPGQVDWLARGGGPGLARRERRVVLVFLAAAFALRMRYAWIFRIDSDEPQHLHIVWAWTRGLLPYRDIFDNHAPLFHILCAPFFSMLGERADSLLIMRMGMAAFAAACLLGIYVLGRELYGKRVGAWAAVLAAFEPHFFFTGSEFRADDLWAAAWVLFMSALVMARGRPARLFLAGLALGATFSTSLKTSLLAVSLLVALLAAAAFLLIGGAWRWPRGKPWAGALALILGAGLLPGCLWLYFGHEQALDAARYCLVEHNIVPGLKRWDHLRLHTAIFCLVLPLLLGGAYAIYRGTRGAVNTRAWRAVLLLAPALYYTLLLCFWPDVTREDDLPFSPLAILNLTPVLLWLGSRVAEKTALKPIWLLPAAAVLVETGMIITQSKPWHNDAARDVATYAVVLNLTKPEDYVMDGKAGAVYRRRPYYYVLETITRARIKLGTIKDDVPYWLEKTRTGVVEPGNYLKRLKSAPFVAENYIPLTAGSENVCVLGKNLGLGAADAPIPFQVHIPATYTFMQPDGHLVAGTLDGKEVNGPVDIQSGLHTFSPAAGQPGEPVILFWSNAWQKHYLPSLQRAADLAKDLREHGRGGEPEI